MQLSLRELYMGGLGKRFRDAGYDMPKYMIEARGRTLFEWSMISLAGYREAIAQYIFLALRDEAHDVEGFIGDGCRALGIDDPRVILLEQLTDGQATTALLAKEYWHSENALLIYNIDTYVEPGEMNAAELKGDGFIPCFRAEGEHWSFVRLDGNGRVVEIKEKQRISDHCTLGAYYFRTCRLYRDLYEDFYDASWTADRGEKYVAPLYDHLLHRGGEIYISDVPAERVHVLGTPEELKVFAGKR